MRSAWIILRSTIDGFIEDEMLTRGAAIAYYSVFALAPILVVAIALAGLIFGEDAARGAIVGELSGFMGAQSAEVLQSIIRGASNPRSSIWATAVGIGALVVTASEQLDDALLAMQLGARGVVLKHFAIETLLEAIRAVAHGKTWLPSWLRDEIGKRDREPRYKGLTRREYEIVRHAALGLRNVEIARRLLISEVTVKTHLTWQMERPRPRELG